MLKVFTCSLDANIQCIDIIRRDANRFILEISFNEKLKYSKPRVYMYDGLRRIAGDKKAFLKKRGHNANLFPSPDCLPVWPSRNKVIIMAVAV